MGRATVLRVHENLKLRENKEVLANLKHTLGEFEIVEYADRIPAESYQRRADSILYAFQYILQALPTDKLKSSQEKDKLNAAILKWRGLFAFDAIDDVDKLQKQLNRYTALMVKLLYENWPFSNIKEAIECLNKAEQYQILMNGTESVASLVSSGEDYILLWDQRMPGNHAMLKKELAAIKAFKGIATPGWFRQLKSWQQGYLTDLSQSFELSQQKLRQDINDFYILWRELCHDEKRMASDLSKIAQQSSPLPSWYVKLPRGKQQLLEALNFDSFQITTALESFGELIKKLGRADDFLGECAKLRQLPFWYWMLEEDEQHFLCFALEQLPSPEDILAFLPSRLRTIPTLANFRAHTLMLADKSGRIRFSSGARYGFAHVASRDILGLAPAIKRRHAEANLGTILSQKPDGAPLLLQTLVSPIKHTGMPDYDIAQDLFKTVQAHERAQHTPDIFLFNHALNFAKYLLVTSEDSQNTRLIALAREKLGTLEQQSPEYKRLDQLIETYLATLRSSPGSATVFDYTCRELFLSSQEQLLMLLIGGLPSGSCVSGKDRKSIAYLHENAKLIYYERYGIWPQLNDTGLYRLRFVDIFASLYCSLHAHVLAGQNAPGSDGIKTPDRYLPNDICKEIKKRMGENALKEDDRMATNNEISRIDKSMALKVASAGDSCWLTSEIMGEEQCHQLLMILAELFSLYKFLNKEARGSKKIIQALESYDPTAAHGVSARKIVTDILIAVTERPENNSYREKRTQQLYDPLKQLIKKPAEAGEMTAEVIAQLADLQRKYFSIAEAIGKQHCQSFIDILSVIVDQKNIFKVAPMYGFSMIYNPHDSPFIDDLRMALKTQSARPPEQIVANLLIIAETYQLKAYKTNSAEKKVADVLSTLLAFSPEKEKKMEEAISQLANFKEHCFQTNTKQQAIECQ